MKKCKKDKHVWNMGGECVVCGTERGSLSATTRLAELDDDKYIPTTNGEEYPRGFWGNNTTGYRTDNENN